MILCSEYLNLVNKGLISISKLSNDHVNCFYPVVNFAGVAVILVALADVWQLDQHVLLLVSGNLNLITPVLDCAVPRLKNHRALILLLLPVLYFAVQVKLEVAFLLHPKLIFL